MLKLSFNQTPQELMVRAAATIVFRILDRAGCPQVRVSDLAEKPQYGFTASAIGEPVGPRLVRITDLQDARINWDSVPYCECDEPDKYRLARNDLLFARTGATTGKTHLVTEPQEAVFASYLIRLRPGRGVAPKYLYAFFQSDNYWEQVTGEKRGSAQSNVNGEKLASLRVPNIGRNLQEEVGQFIQVVRARQDGHAEPLPELPPPLHAAKQTVARVEQLAAKIEEARVLRNRSTSEMDTLTASIVQDIFDRVHSPSWTTGHLGDYVVDARYGTSEKTADDSAGVPILRMGNIQNGALDTRDLRFLRLSFRDRESLLLKRGDILVNRTNSAELVGKCAVFDREGEWGFASYLIRLRLDRDRADPVLVARYVNSPIGRQYMFRERKQMTGQANVNSRKLKALPICLPPLPEQRRIVAYLDGLQAKVDSLKALQAKSAAELDALLPSILDKAFKGEL